jgi:segregation and condensation protein A
MVDAVIDHGKLYTVSLPDFEGPLDLLLNLIEERKLPITDISLAAVADQYVTYVKQLEEIDPATVMEYLLIAVRLMVIKSQVLLPRPPETDGEENEADNLAEQLIAYKKAKETAQLLRQIEENKRRSFLRSAPPVRVQGPIVLAQHDIEELTDALLRALSRVKAAEAQPLELPPRVSIESRIDHIRGRIGVRSRLAFGDLIGSSVTLDELIATFLALLQLLKRREVEATQDSPLGEIWIERLTGPVEAELDNEIS